MKLRTAFMIVNLLSLALEIAAIGQERPKVTSISHLAVYTTDPVKAENFYVHDLGAVKGTDPENPAGVRYYFSTAQFVEVLPLPAGPVSVNRLDHAGFNTSDAEAMRKYLQAHSVEVPSAVTKASCTRTSGRTRPSIRPRPPGTCTTRSTATAKPSTIRSRGWIPT